jgi:hypothetical protein
MEGKPNLCKLLKGTVKYVSYTKMKVISSISFKKIKYVNFTSKKENNKSRNIARLSNCKRIKKEISTLFGIPDEENLLKMIKETENPYPNLKDVRDTLIDIYERVYLE